MVHVAIQCSGFEPCVYSQWTAGKTQKNSAMFTSCEDPAQRATDALLCMIIRPAVRKLMQLPYWLASGYAKMDRTVNLMNAFMGIMYVPLSYILAGYAAVRTKLLLP